MWKVVSGALLAGSVIFATVQWVLLHSTVADILTPLGLGVAEGLGLGDADVAQGTAEALRRLAEPRALLRVSGRISPYLLGAAAVVVMVWIKADLRSEALRGRILFAGLIALPTLVALGVLAGPGTRTSVGYLSEAGLTNPGLVGSSVAEIYVMVLLSLALGAVLAVVFLGLLRRDRPSSGAGRAGP